MKDGLIEIKNCTEEGYHPQIWFEGWRVAYLNDTPKFHAESITEMHRHNTSDEVFILLKGNCTLYVGDGRDSVDTVYAVPMELEKMYNIPKGVWHTHITSEGARLVIIENADVSPENTDYAPVDIKALR
ncbi:MAG: hypothetical protein PWQ60_1197 [Thermoanaerobacteraceae bacterium]|jgi:mannose-6-phosphate isomerase-like protein (cupin superfamily)|nr:hypothetical protein [Thermoanaerobacteraceae bacterium]